MTSEMPGGMGLRLDDIAARLVQSTAKPFHRAHYQALLRDAALLLRQHGLGQTLAYLQARGAGRSSSAHQVLYEQLGAWLRERLALPAGDALGILTRADSRLYLQASEEASALILALRRALAQGETSSTPDTSQGSPREVE